MIDNIVGAAKAIFKLKPKLFSKITSQARITKKNMSGKMMAINWGYSYKCCIYHKVYRQMTLISSRFSENFKRLSDMLLGGLIDYQMRY